MSAYLGFDRPVENTFDAGQVGGTDVCVDAALELVHPMLHVGQFIAELMQQYAQPRPWILVSATYASSAMPQKRNPGPLIDIRRDASVVLAESNSVVMRTHNLPTGMYDAKDEKLNREIVGDASSVLERFAAVLGLLKVDKARALEELNLDWTASQELADVLMRRFAIPFRVGHGFASRMVTVARTEGFTPKRSRLRKRKPSTPRFMRNSRRKCRNSRQRFPWMKSDSERYWILRTSLLSARSQAGRNLWNSRSSLRRLRKS